LLKKIITEKFRVLLDFQQNLLLKHEEVRVFQSMNSRKELKKEWRVVNEIPEKKGKQRKEAQLEFLDERRQIQGFHTSISMKMPKKNTNMVALFS